MDKSLVQNLKRRIQTNKYLPELLKEKIVAIDDTSPDIIYLYYPLLFNSVFKVASETANIISIAGFYYYNSLIVLDRILDGDTKKNIWVYNLKNICVLQEETIKILTNVYGSESPFWNLWNLRKQEYEEIFIFERELSNKDFSFLEYKKIAINKSAFGKVAIDCLSLFSKNKNDYKNALYEFHDFFSISNQLVDDLIDFSEDIDKGQVNWLYNELRKKDNFTQISKANYKKAIYIEGIARSSLVLSLEYLKKASKIAEKYNLDLWQDILEKRRINIETQIENIDLHIKIAEYQSTQSKLKIEVNSCLESIQKAKDYIGNRQLKNGSWEEYVNQGGISNVWATAFVLSNLEKIDDFKNITSLAIKFLKSNRKKELWSYNPAWIEDFDSSSFVILSFMMHNTKYRNIDIKKWLSYQDINGGFKTYKNEEELSELIINNDSFGGWYSPQPCVSATAFYALSRFSIDKKAHSACLNYFNQLLKEESIYSYWWTDSIYTYSYLIRGLYLSNRKSVANKLAEKYISSFLSKVINSSDKNSFFYIGLALNTLIELKRPMFKEIIDLGIDYLKNNQMEDGSWEGSNALQVPKPNSLKPSKGSDTWGIKTYGVNVRCFEFNRLFSTSSCLAAMNSYVHFCKQNEYY